MNYKKTIFIILAICLLGMVIPKAVQAEESGCQQWCTNSFGEYNPDYCRQIGKGGSSVISGSACSGCKKISEGVYDCTCQGSNKMKDCHIGFLISNPVCSCCGDCVLNDFLLMGVNAAGNVLGFLGVFALLFFVIGGIIWITSGGSAEKVKKGKDMIKGAVVGLIIVLVAFTIVRVIMEAFGTEGYLPQSSEITEDGDGEWVACPSLSDISPTRPWCYSCVWTGVDKGCKSSEVKTYQQKLNNWNCNCGTPDGKFGPGTRDCTKRFQQANGGSCPDPDSYCLGVDGMVGPATKDAYTEILKSTGVITNPCQ